MENAKKKREVDQLVYLCSFYTYSINVLVEFRAIETHIKDTENSFEMYSTYIVRVLVQFYGDSSIDIATNNVMKNVQECT